MFYRALMFLLITFFFVSQNRVFWVVGVTKHVYEYKFKGTSLETKRLVSSHHCPPTPASLLPPHVAGLTSETQVSSQEDSQLALKNTVAFVRRSTRTRTIVGSYAPSASSEDEEDDYAVTNSFPSNKNTNSTETGPLKSEESVLTDSETHVLPPKKKRKTYTSSTNKVPCKSDKLKNLGVTFFTLSKKLNARQDAGPNGYRYRASLQIPDSKIYLTEYFTNKKDAILQYQIWVNQLHLEDGENGVQKKRGKWIALYGRDEKKKHVSSVYLPKSEALKRRKEWTDQRIKELKISFNARCKKEMTK